MGTGSAAMGGGVGLLLLSPINGNFDLGFAAILDFTHSHSLALKVSTLFSLLMESSSMFIRVIPLNIKPSLLIDRERFGWLSLPPLLEFS